MKKESRKKVRISELSFDQIGDRITFIRLMQGKTVEEFSSLLGISKGNLSDLENSRNKPSYEVIACMAEYSDINSEWIISGKGRLFKRKNPGVTASAGENEHGTGPGFRQRDLVSKILADASMIESISPNALAEIADYINVKLNNLLKFGERRKRERRELFILQNPPDDNERRSGYDRRTRDF